MIIIILSIYSCWAGHFPYIFSCIKAILTSKCIFFKHFTNEESKVREYCILSKLPRVVVAGFSNNNQAIFPLTQKHLCKN